jgi:death-on-curing protein
MVQGDGGEVAWLDEFVGNVRGWHDVALKAGGGAPGEHAGRLFASCARPFQTAFGDDLFPDDIAKAASLFHGIISGHPFIDGNKRTATISAVLFLFARRAIHDLGALQLRLLGELAVATAASRLTVEDVTFWLHRVLDPREHRDEP